MTKYILILGGGQLAMMLAKARNKLNIDHKILVWEKTRDCPASIIDGVNVIKCSSYEDIGTLEKTIHRYDIVSAIPEFENVPFETATFLEQNNILVCPHSRLIRNSQHRYLEKNCLNHFVDTPQFINIPNYHQSLLTITALNNKEDFFPALLKTNRFGYDGKGQWLINDIDHLKNILTRTLFSQHPDGFVLEKKIEIDKEISVIVARDREGNTVTLPITENYYDHGTLKWSITPADLSENQQQKIEQMAKKLAQAYQIQGLFTIELFVTKEGAILANEIAPRVHNSGHHTIEFLNYSQFDLAILTAIGINLKSIDIQSQAPYAIMVNLLGLNNKISEKNYDRWIENINKQVGGSLWNYHKKPIKHFRKMGHITALGYIFTEVIATKDRILSAYYNENSPLEVK